MQVVQCVRPVDLPIACNVIAHTCSCVPLCLRLSTQIGRNAFPA